MYFLCVFMTHSPTIRPHLLDLLTIDLKEEEAETFKTTSNCVQEPVDTQEEEGPAIKNEPTLQIPRSPQSSTTASLSPTNSDQLDTSKSLHISEHFSRASCGLTVHPVLGFCSTNSSSSSTWKTSPPETDQSARNRRLQFERLSCLVDSGAHKRRVDDRMHRCGVFRLEISETM